MMCVLLLEQLGDIFRKYFPTSVRENEGYYEGLAYTSLILSYSSIALPLK